MAAIIAAAMMMETLGEHECFRRSTAEGDRPHEVAAGHEGLGVIRAEHPLTVDEQLGEKVGMAAESMADYVNRIANWQLKVNLRSEWLRPLPRPLPQRAR